MGRIISILIFVALSASGASWYVDNAATGSNSGTSWANAWTNFGSVVWDGAGVKAGDTLYISGGTTSKSYIGENNTYTPNATMSATLPICAGGSSGSPITITVGTDVGHNGRAIISGNSNVTAVCIAMFDYLVVDGGPKTNLVFCNNVNTANRNSYFGIRGGGSYCKFNRLIVSNVNYGIGCQGLSGNMTGLEVSSNRVVGILGDSCIGTTFGAETLDAIKVHHNFVESVLDDKYSGNPAAPRYGGPDGITIGRGCSIYNNTLTNRLGPSIWTDEQQHPDGITSGGGVNYLNRTKIYNNHISAFYNAAFELGFEVDTKDVYVFNNVVFYSDTNILGASHTLFEGDGPMNTLSNVYWFNNTFVNFNLPSWCWGWEDKSAATHPVCTNFGMWNNLFYRCGNTRLALFWAYVDNNMKWGDWDIRNNLCYGGATNFNMGQSASWNYTNYNGVYLDPLFAETNRYSIATNSPAIGAGTNLTAFMAEHSLPAVDFDGNARPNAAWTIGAFELGSTNAPVDPPTDPPSAPTPTTGVYWPTLRANRIIIR